MQHGIVLLFKNMFAVVNSAHACSNLFLTVAIVTPLTYTAYLGQTAVGFNCSIPINATNISFYWHVNSINLGSAELEARGIEIVNHRTIHKSSLIIPSTVVNNNTHLKCFGNYRNDGSQLRVAESTEATFHVQGQLVVTSINWCS